MNNLSVFVKVVGKLPDTGANDKTVVKITPEGVRTAGRRGPPLPGGGDVPAQLIYYAL
jgi:hypothetical protein